MATKVMALTDADFADTATALTDADFQDVPKQDPMKTYKNENIGDVWNNVMVRPGAGVRNVLRGGDFIQGFSDPNSVQTFQNQALDSFYNSGFLSEHPAVKEALGVGVSAGGLAADIATNPADLLGMLIGKAPIKGTGTTLAGEISGSKIGQTVGRMANAPVGAQTINPRLSETPGALERLKSMQLAQKGRSEVSKLLPDLNLSTDIKQNRPTDALTEGFNLIKKTNNPVEVADKFRVEKQGITNQVNQLVQENNRPANPNLIASRARLILQKDIKHGSQLQRNKMLKAIQDEEAWVKEQKTFDTNAINERKRVLYQETAPMQKKQAMGEPTALSAEKLKVKDAFAQAYKESVEAVHPDVQKLNARFDGLNKGLDAASKMAEKLQESGSLVERIATQTLGRPNVAGGVAAFVREVPRMLTGLGSRTGKIEKLASKSAEFLAESRRLQGERLLASFMRKQKMDMPNSEYFSKVLTPNDVMAYIGVAPESPIAVRGERGLATKMNAPVKQYQPQLEGPASMKSLSGETVGGKKQLPAPEKFERLSGEQAELRRIQQKKGKYTGGKGKSLKKTGAVEQAISRLINRVR